jgi:hypothetical protein
MDNKSITLYNINDKSVIMYNIDDRSITLYNIMWVTEVLKEKNLSAMSKAFAEGT